MRFEKSLRRLARRLPQQELPSSLRDRLMASLPEVAVAVPAKPHGKFAMKPLLLNTLLLATTGFGFGLVYQRAKHHPPVGPHLHFVDPSGHPVKGLPVTLNGRNTLSVSATTDPQGNVYLRSDDNLREFSAHGNGVSAAGKIALSENQEQVVVLSANLKNVVIGRIVDDQGEPVVGQKVQLYQLIFLDDTKQRTTGTTIDALTGTDGRFRFPLVPGNYYNITATVPGFALVSIPPVIGPEPEHLAAMIRIKDGDYRDLGNITLLRADSFVDGVVVDAAGRGVDARVSVDGAKTNADAYTDKSGRFHITNVVRGETLHLVVRTGENGYDDRQHWYRRGVRAGVTGLKIVLKPTEKEKFLPIR